MEGIKVVNTGINPVQKQTLETRSDFSGVNSVLPYPDKNDEQYPDYLSNIGKTLIQNFKHKTENDKKIEQAEQEYLKKYANEKDADKYHKIAAEQMKYMATDYLKNTPDGGLTEIRFNPGYKIDILMSGNEITDVLDVKNSKVYTKAGYLYNGDFENIEEKSISTYKNGELIFKMQDGNDGKSIDIVVYKDGKPDRQEHIELDV